MKVVNFGSMNIDYVCRVASFVRPGETATVRDLRTYCGGKGLNQSIALARAGAEVWHAGFVGEDGAFLEDRLRQSGVRTKLLRKTADRSGQAIIQVDDAGENCILVYPGTNGMLTEEYVEEVLSILGPQDVVLVQNETNLVGEIIERAAARGLRIAFNAAPVSQALRTYPLEKITWLFVNELEGQFLSDETDPICAFSKLQEQYPHTEIIMTLGAEGSLHAENGRVSQLGACAVRVVDTTGAGDTFVGYFLRGAVDPPSQASPLLLGTVAAAISVTRPGAEPSVPLLEEVLASPLRPADE